MPEEKSSHSTYYKAPAPASRPLNILAKRKLLRTFFPPVIVWDLVKFGANQLLGTQIGRLILPAQENHHETSPDDLNDQIKNINESEKLSAQQIDIETHDGATLKTLEIKYKHEEKNEPSIDQQQYIINFMGNNTQFQCHIEDMQQEAEILECNVIAFDYRNVGLSRGQVKSKYDLITDGIAQVQRLLAQGVDPENITLKGFSLAV